MRARLLVLVLVLGCGGSGHESPSSPGTPGGGGAATLSGSVTTLGTTTPVAGAVASAGGQTSTTGADGRYALTGLTATTVTLSVTRSGYETFSKTIVLSAGANLLDVQLSQSTSGTSVTGNVQGLFPISGATVNLSGATVSIAGKTDTTDAAGNFQLPTIPEGNQLVTVKLAGWKDYSQSFFISSTNRNLSLQMDYGLPVLTPQNLPAQVLLCNCSADEAFIGAAIGPLTSTSQYAYTVTASSWRLAAMLASGQECTTCSRLSANGQQNGPPGTCSTARRECCPANGQPVCPLPSPATSGGPGTLYAVAAGQAPTGRVLVRQYGVGDQNCGSTEIRPSSVRLTISGIHVAATNDLNAWTHYDIPTLTVDQPWNSTNTSCP